MSKDEEKKSSYVEKVREGTQRYTHDLLRENEKLRALIASLESEKARLERDAERIRLLEADQESLRTSLSASERENDRLGSQLRQMTEKVSGFEREQVMLEKKLTQVETQNRQFDERYSEVEQQNANLANLYVASFRLHSTLDRDEILGGIQEIVINLVGADELAIFELDPAGEKLELIASSGIDPSPYQNLSASEGLIGKAVETSEIVTLSPDDRALAIPRESTLTACIPLRLDGKVSGAIAIFRLLEQKTSLEDLDRELFELLATHAAIALYCTSLHREMMSLPAGISVELES